MPHNNCCKFQEPTDSSETSSMHNLEQSICYNCHKLGHMSRDCPEEQPKACFKCGFRGHYYRECPSQIEKKFVFLIALLAVYNTTFASNSVCHITRKPLMLRAPCDVYKNPVQF
ncbi:CCHC-type domain-containing protein [Caenorhabditis elegans]|uniref:CCHC-type domain-containing protein n=2 Tax=Caenorhabditis elegans TaxID=6239 RepID=D5MCP3_CAEEL|nr:CCHC-type domain-containing protein [Caenorhabditis elegans]CBL43439.1 CCHC-type domain-containing protein [Caenorhabditis elegans]|eukprot:NP_001255048.1 Uncharacterized protein CELE_F40F12.9 [Caenorhabditis elegans]